MEIALHFLEEEVMMPPLKIFEAYFCVIEGEIHLWKGPSAHGSGGHNLSHDLVVCEKSDLNQWDF